MEILELYLQHYGKFENHRIPLKPGINVIYGGNESGKTTIHSFIRAMLFGMNRGRGKAARNDEYQIRQPWNAPGAFLGSMKIESQGQIYRIDRCFDRSTEPLRVTCETTMWESPSPERALEVLLGGVSEAAFTNTLCIPQAGGETGDALAQELRRFMINSDSSKDGQTDVAKALEKLRRRKKQAEQKKKKEDEVLENRIEEKQARAELLRSEIRLLKEQYERRAGQGREIQGRAGGEQPGRMPEGRSGSELSGRMQGSRAGSELSGWMPEGRTRIGGRASERERRTRRDSEDAFYRRSRWIIRVLLFLTGILSLISSYFMRDRKTGIFLGICGIFFLALIFAVNFMFRAEEEEPEEWDADGNGGPDLPVTGAEGSGAGLQRDGRTQERGAGPENRQDYYLREEIRSREEAYRKLQDELEALYHSHVKLDGADTEIAALTMAIDRICELSSGIYEQSGRQLNERASEILSDLTQGRYNRILLDETAEVRIHTPSRVLGLSQVSGGTMQQIYFALRMASAELLCGDRQLPVLLDEPFVMYDNARLEAALRWLKASGRQVILFTCQKREREILERIR